jgi:hypothetical protein
MEPTETITQHPSELLRQVGTAMNWRHTEISVTVPVVTTWKTVLRATDSALGEVDGPVIITPRRPESHRQILRQVALQNVQIANSLSPVETSPGRPIRTQYDIKSLPFPEPASNDTRKRLKESAELFYDFAGPYPVILHATITEGTLPVVKANVIINGVDSSITDPPEILKFVDVLWDTGAQQTIVTEDLLSESFRRYLQDPQHDPYRSGNGLRVQMDAVIGFSNGSIKISAIAMVVPKSVVPNERVGILFGQQQCIDRISYHSIPRRILEAKGEDIKEELWGDIVLDEFIDVDGKMLSF